MILLVVFFAVARRNFVDPFLRSAGSLERVGEFQRKLEDVRKKLVRFSVHSPAAGFVLTLREICRPRKWDLML